MDYIEAAQIFTSLAEALRSDPNQFDIQITIIGNHVTSNGGIGQVVSAQGGGAGSNTIGLQATATTGNITLTNTQADTKRQAEISRLAAEIDALASELNSLRPNPSTIWTKFMELARKWAPSIITETIKQILTMVFPSHPLHQR